MVSLRKTKVIRKTHCRTNNIKTENNELQKVSTKNRTCYYFHDIIKTKDFHFDNILLDEKSYKNILIKNILYKTDCAKPLRFRFDKVDGFIRVYDRTRYLVLFGPEKYDAIYNRIRYLIILTGGITYVISHNYARIKIDLYDSLPLEENIDFT